jgi:hypothetical protein
VLRALYQLAQADRPADAGSVGRALGMRTVDVARVLLVLDARGLARADRARLTLSGLVEAARVAPLEITLEPRRTRRKTFASSVDSFSLLGRVVRRAEDR